MEDDTCPWLRRQLRREVLLAQTECSAPDRMDVAISAINHKYSKSHATVRPPSPLMRMMAAPIHHQTARSVDDADREAVRRHDITESSLTLHCRDANIDAFEYELPEAKRPRRAASA